MFLLAGKIMPGAEKLREEILFPEEKLFQATRYSYENSYPIFSPRAYLDIKRTLASCLIMGDSKGFIGVDSTPVFRTHQVTIGKKSIGLTTSAITIVPIAISTIASVESYSHSVLVTFPSIIFRTPNIVSQIGIAIVVTIITSMNKSIIGLVLTSLSNDVCILNRLYQPLLMKVQYTLSNLH